jgi:hypothetical protein
VHLVGFIIRITMYGHLNVKYTALLVLYGYSKKKFIRNIYVPVKHGMVHNEKLGDFYKSSSFVGTMKFKSLKWC